MTNECLRNLKDYVDKCIQQNKKKLRRKENDILRREKLKQEKAK